MIQSRTAAAAIAGSALAAGMMITATAVVALAAPRLDPLSEGRSLSTQAQVQNFTPEWNSSGPVAERGFYWTQGQGGYYLNEQTPFSDFGGAGFGYTDSDPQASHRTAIRAGRAIYEGWGDWTEQSSAQASNPSRPV
jgi:hypothetical protein